MIFRQNRESINPRRWKVIRTQKFYPPLGTWNGSRDCECFVNKQKNTSPPTSLVTLILPTICKWKKVKKKLLFITGCRRRGRRKFGRHRWRQCWNVSNVYILVQATVRTFCLKLIYQCIVIVRLTWMASPCTPAPVRVPMYKDTPFEVRITKAGSNFIHFFYMCYSGDIIDLSIMVPILLQPARIH